MWWNYENVSSPIGDESLLSRRRHGDDVGGVGGIVGGIVGSDQSWTSFACDMLIRWICSVRLPPALRLGSSCSVEEWKLSLTTAAAAATTAATVATASAATTTTTATATGI